MIFHSMIHVGNLVIRFVANYSYLPSPCLCLFYQIHEKMLIRCPTTTVTYHRLAQQASTQMSSRPSLQDQGDYELVSSKSHPQNRVIDVEDDTEMEDVSEPYKPVVVYRSPYCHERFITHFRKHAVFSSLFMVFAGLMCLSILALVSFIPDCTFKKDDGNDRYERALYADIRPRPESIPLVNTSTVNGTLLLEQFYTQYYHNITSKTYRIALLGDSLVGGLYITYDIKTMLQLYLPMFSFEILPFDVSGSRIADIRNRLDKVIAAKPDGTFLFFDSDCYDIDEYLLSRSKVSDIRDAYRTNLEYVLSTLLNSNPNGIVALGGPSIAGEGPLFGPVPIWSYQHKKLQLDQYRSINNEIAASLDVPYVDVRGAFLKFLEGYQGRLGYYGCLTTDGNHENPLGARLIVYWLARALLPWLLNQHNAGIIPFSGPLQ